MQKKDSPGGTRAKSPPNALGQVPSLVRELDPTCHSWRFCALQWRSKIPHATIKTWHGQINNQNKHFLKKEWKRKLHWSWDDTFLFLRNTALLKFRILKPHLHWTWCSLLPGILRYELLRSGTEQLWLRLGQSAGSALGERKAGPKVRWQVPRPHRYEPGPYSSLHSCAQASPHLPESQPIQPLRSVCKGLCHD